MLFPTHLQARELYQQTYSLSLPLIGFYLIWCLQFLLWKQQTTINGYMTKTLRVWEGGYTFVTVPTNNEESCLTGTLVLQGIVTYTGMFHVEAFATGIKIESSDQNPFWGQSRDQEHTAAIRHLKIKHSTASEGNDQAIKHTFC